ncbi:MAG: MFS transporter, partial [Alphaproteobacteria bacterium]|nr:MFS transporter [Alphaproteobacteria bacterium]
SLLAGGTFQSVGWAAVNLAAVPLLILVLAAVFWLRGRRMPVAA